MRVVVQGIGQAHWRCSVGKRAVLKLAAAVASCDRGPEP